MTDVSEGTGTEMVAWELPRIRPETKRPSNFLDHVDMIMDKLWPEEGFYQYLNALTNKNSITGKFEVDRGFAAKQIQDAATESGIMDVATAKLSKIMNAIETLLRREKKGRKQRLEALHLLEAQQAEIGIAAE
jgi:hypothetical protein